MPTNLPPNPSDPHGRPHLKTPGETSPPLHIIAYGPDQLEEKDLPDIASVQPFLDRFPVTWINIVGTSDPALIRSIGAFFHLHELSIEDILSDHQRAKAETFPEYEFVVAQIPNIQNRCRPDRLSVFFSKRYVITFHPVRLESFESVRNRLRKNQTQPRRLGPDYLAYVLLDSLVDSYFPFLEQYGERLDQLEDQTLLGGPMAQAKDLHRIKRELFSFRRACWPLRDVVNSLLRDGGELLSAETRLHLRDLYDHVVQMIDLLETYRELASDLMDLHLASISNRMNEVMRVLTIIATIFIPITFLASIYGMNFDHIPELHWRYGYPMILAVMGVIAGSMLLWFWRKGWLRSFFPSSR